MAALFWTVFSFLLLAVWAMSPISRKCPCSDPANCGYQNGGAGLVREVFVFSNGATNVKSWRWETFNTVVAPATFSIENSQERNTMCYTHQKKRQFGITVNMDLRGRISNTSDEAKAWVGSVASKQAQWYADLVNVDLMTYFSKDVQSTQPDHVQLALVLKDLKHRLNQDSITNIKMMCVVPWRPACPSDQKKDCPFTDMAVDGCDFFLINPDSFEDDSDTAKCRAGPTIPFAKLISGISDYIAHHVAFSQVVIGIPWHGYDYKCSHLEGDVCNLEVHMADGIKTVCQRDRQRLPLATIYDRFRNHVGQPVSNPIYNSPHFNYNNHSVPHQVWYEEHLSLKSKYKLAIQLNLKGIGILYVDDLQGYTTQKILAHEGMVWSWLSHQVLLHKSESTHSDLHEADTVAGVAVGCLLLGTFLGVVLTCLALRRTVRKPKPPPFVGDHDGDMDEFVDDPDL